MMVEETEYGHQALLCGQNSWLNKDASQKCVATAVNKVRQKDRTVVDIKNK